jgi:hypothetical protein
MNPRHTILAIHYTIVYGVLCLSRSGIMEHGPGVPESSSSTRLHHITRLHHQHACIIFHARIINTLESYSTPVSSTRLYHITRPHRSCGRSCSEINICNINTHRVTDYKSGQQQQQHYSCRLHLGSTLSTLLADSVSRRLLETLSTSAQI